MLAAPAIASGVIHKVLAFVAPKIIGGTRAPTPVGELGNVEMTQVCGQLLMTYNDMSFFGYLCVSSMWRHVIDIVLLTRAVRGRTALQAACLA